MKIPKYRLIIYAAILYFGGFFLGTLTNPQIACVDVDGWVMCGRIVK